LVDVLVECFEDPLPELATFVSVVVAVFGPWLFGAFDAFAAFVAFGAVVTFVVGDDDFAVVGALEDEAFTGAGAFPFEAASAGVIATQSASAALTVISVMRMRFHLAWGPGATEIPFARAGKPFLFKALSEDGAVIRIFPCLASTEPSFECHK